MGRLEGQVAVVTGASRGIGRAFALAIAREGAHVIAVARTPGALEELDDDIKALGHGDGATLVPLDLKDHDALDRLGHSIWERWGSLDILVGNAGILGPITPVGHITPELWQDLLDINLTANWRLIRSLEPVLRQSESGARALFLSSGAATKHKPFWGGYSMTKAALESLVQIWAAETKDSTMRINLFNPGATRTGMRAAAAPGEDPMTLPTPQEVVEHALPLLMPDCAHHGQVLNAR